MTAAAKVDHSAVIAAEMIRNLIPSPFASSIFLNFGYTVYSETILESIIL